MRKILSILAFCFPVIAGATHLVGGCIELKWNGGDNYTLIVKILRDCENGSPEAYFDRTIAVGIFEKNTHIKKQEFTLTFSSNNDDTLKFTGDNCASIKTGCTHIGTYTKDITLPSNTYSSNNGYYLSWQRCCRNGIITNIVNPGDAGMALYTEVPNLKTVKNSSPRYTSNPVTLMCTNNLFEYNMNFTDDDGDQLVYSIIEPVNGLLDKFQPSSNTSIAGPYPNVVWQNGYSNAGAIDGIVPLTIDAATGKITCNPSNPGVYVASIRVQEFRFGVQIGEVRLELQFTVTNCPNTPPVSTILDISNAVMTADTVIINIPESKCFKVRGVDKTDSVFLRIHVEGLDSAKKNVPVFDTLSKGLLSAETTICWQTDCELEKQAPVPFFINLRDNGCPIARNAETKLWVKFKPMPLVSSTDLLCMSMSNNIETTTYYGDSTDPANPYFKYYVVFRGIDYQNYKPIDTIAGKSGRLFVDGSTPDYMNINYTYFMVGYNKCNNPGPTSDTLSTFEQKEFIPQKQYIRYVTVEDNNRIEIDWPETPERDFAKYFLYKSDRASSRFNLIQTFEQPDQTHYTDHLVNVNDTSYCYYLVMKDTCDNIGPQGKVACTILLSGKAFPFKNEVQFTDYQGWQGGVSEYKVFRADPVNYFAGIGSAKDSQTVYLDQELNLNEGLFYYYIEAKENESAGLLPFFDTLSRSNVISLFQSPWVHVPNAFTMNGDGLNDDFKWVPVFVKDFEIRIFNRWGETVYHTNDKNAPWNGMYDGAPCQSDVYFYKIQYSGYDGTVKSTSGNFTLLR